jgi:hypothetical protein
MCSAAAVYLLKHMIATAMQHVAFFSSEKGRQEFHWHAGTAMTKSSQVTDSPWRWFLMTASAMAAMDI